jgi:hypothetical protein
MKKILLILSLIFSANLYAQSISENEKAGILLMREEEKMARDIYQSLNEKWNQVPFSHISESEIYHMSQMKALIDKFQLTDPVTKNADKRGVFENSSLKKLYDELLLSGNTSLEAAFRAGAKVEEVDIRDLKAEMAKTINEDIKSTYTYLVRASENHLRAFVRNLNSINISYTPVVLSKDEFDAILNSSKGRGMGMGQGKGCARDCARF